MGEGSRRSTEQGAAASSLVLRMDDSSDTPERTYLRVSYLEDALRAVKGMGLNEATILLHGVLAPVIIGGEGRRGLYSLVMPMRAED